MEPLQFTTAHYIKLGQGGKWAADCIQNSRLRLGWFAHTIEDIQAGHWEKIEQQALAVGNAKLGPVRADLNALRRIVESGPNEVWITFHQAKLWWTRITGELTQDAESKYRVTAQWSDKSLIGRLLVINDLPGNIAKLQRFSGTTCRVQHIELLQRLLNGTSSPLADDISKTKKALAGALSKAIQQLHWKDFETLVDLVFRHAGWIRVSILGQQEKGYDLVLQEAITRDRFVVQVKSQAGLAEVLKTASELSPPTYRKVFFVVHSPNTDLVPLPAVPAHVEVVDPCRLGELALNAGLTDWLEDKVA